MTWSKPATQDMIGRAALVGVLQFSNCVTDEIPIYDLDGEFVHPCVLASGGYRSGIAPISPA